MPLFFSSECTAIHESWMYGGCSELSNADISCVESREIVQHWRNGAFRNSSNCKKKGQSAKGR